MYLGAAYKAACKLCTWSIVMCKALKYKNSAQDTTTTCELLSSRMKEESLVREQKIQQIRARILSIAEIFFFYKCPTKIKYIDAKVTNKSTFQILSSLH